MKILDFGSANIDYVYSLDKIVRPGETVSSHELNIFPGGKGINQAVALARAGAETYFAGSIGEDGAFLKKLIEDCGVNTDYLKTTEVKSGHAIIQVEDSGENSIIIYHGANFENDEKYIDCVLSSFSAGDIIVLQNEISNVPYIVKKAVDKNMTVFFNPSPITEQIAEVDFSLIDYLIINETEAIEITGETDEYKAIDSLTDKYENIKIILTLGEKGSIFASGSDRIVTDAYKVSAVDTTAAGDTYTGYFAALISKGYNVKDALHYASVAAGISVSRMGAAPSVPYFEEVQANI